MMYCLKHFANTCQYIIQTSKLFMIKCEFFFFFEICIIYLLSTGTSFIEKIITLNNIAAGLHMFYKICTSSNCRKKQRKESNTPTDYIFITPIVCSVVVICYNSFYYFSSWAVCMLFCFSSLSYFHILFMIETITRWWLL